MLTAFCVNWVGVSNGFVHGPVLRACWRLYGWSMGRNAVYGVQFQDRTQGRELLGRAKRLYLPASNSASACSYPGYRFIFPATLQLARGPAFVGPFFVPLQRPTAYTVGRFLLPIACNQCANTPGVCVQPMERPTPGRRSTPGTPGSAIGVCRAILAPFLRLWHCYPACVFSAVFGAF